MNRRDFVTTTITLALLAAPLAAEAQRGATTPRIGFLSPSSLSDPRTPGRLGAFREGLRELGYEEGQNIAIEYRWAEGKYDRLPSHAAELVSQGLRSLGYVEGQNILIDYRYAGGKDALLPDLASQLVRLNPDVILTWTVVGARVAKQATTTIPIVNGSMSDPVAAGLVPSLARPGGNLTGLTSFSPVLSAKRLELIKEVVPGLSRVALLSTAHPSARLALRETEVAAQSLGIRLQTLDVRGPDDFDGAFVAMARERAGALVLLLDPLFLQHLNRLVDLAAKHRLPAMYWAKQYVEAGGLVSYASSLPDQFRRAATYVDKILKGAKPADLPIEAPTKFELVINLKTAKSLGLTIPQSVLIRADEVIQ